MTKIAINGFGRIGRQFLKALIERHPEIEIVALNDLADPQMNALLFRHDSNYGKYPGEVSATADALVIDGRRIRVLQEKEPAKLPWKDLGVDIVIESTGFFTDATKAKAHLDAGAKYVIISAPAKNEDKTVVLQHPYWTSEHVGTGPFKLRDWVRGSHLTMAANDAYVLGRPKLDEIEIRFFQDTQAMVANLLAGASDMTIGRGLSVAQGLTLRDQWREGGVTFGVVLTWVPIYTQFLTPSPPIVTNPQFRRALTHAMDRQQMADAQCQLALFHGAGRLLAALIVAKHAKKRRVVSSQQHQRVVRLERAGLLGPLASGRSKP